AIGVIGNLLEPYVVDHETPESVEIHATGKTFQHQVAHLAVMTALPHERVDVLLRTRAENGSGSAAGRIAHKHRAHGHAGTTGIDVVVHSRGKQYGIALLEQRENIFRCSKRPML